MNFSTPAPVTASILRTPLAIEDSLRILNKPISDEL